MNKTVFRAFGVGIISAFFFAFTFLLNRRMNLTGGYWMWSGCIRYFVTYPILALILAVTKGRSGFLHIHQVIRKSPRAWILWSTVGFFLFYAPLTLAGDYGESWLIAASWQMTIVLGILLTPLFHQPIPKKNISICILILVGIFLLQAKNITELNVIQTIMTLIPIMIAGISYPLGNRKMMSIVPDDITTLERVYGMTLCSLPAWIILAIIALCTNGLPSPGQIGQSSLVALFSGVIATLLFFKATDMVKHNARWLAIVESTESGEVIFTLLGGLIFLHDAIPTGLGILGLIFIIGGMICNSIMNR